MRVTLIDDNLLMSSQIGAKLTQLGLAYQVIGTPDNVAERLSEAPPEVILVNLASDRLRPFDLVRAIKADLRLTRIPIVGYAGHTERSHIDAGRQAGCDRVVANSAVTGDLRAVLSPWLQSAAPSDE